MSENSVEISLDRNFARLSWFFSASLDVLKCSLEVSGAVDNSLLAADRFK